MNHQVINIDFMVWGTLNIIISLQLNSQLLLSKLIVSILRIEPLLTEEIMSGEDRNMITSGREGRVGEGSCVGHNPQQRRREWTPGLELRAQFIRYICHCAVFEYFHSSPQTTRPPVHTSTLH